MRSCNILKIRRIKILHAYRKKGGLDLIFLLMAALPAIVLKKKIFFILLSQQFFGSRKKKWRTERMHVQMEINTNRLLRRYVYNRVTTGAGKARKAGKPVLFSNREAGKAGISTFEI